ncbi:hypothetical protein BGX28_009053 [Mortierella sp. GBA30]|nr:hypothetical protein BGX28_009053 [Mortierella sp. GBA30]
MTTKDTKTWASSGKTPEWDLHPLTNRTHENSDIDQTTQQYSQDHLKPQSQATTSTSASSTNSTALKPACCCGKNEWDLHPAMIRKIENEGSPADVKLLHDLEHHCERAEHKHGI